MILFRKRKVQKLVEQYFDEYHRKIPENAIAREELLQLREVNLETIALAYDSLEGYKYYVGSTTQDSKPNVEHDVPDHSKWKPSTKSKSKAKCKLTRLLRIRAQMDFRKEAEYLVYPKIEHDRVFLDSSGGCFKCFG